MKPEDEVFTPETVDEQVEQLSRSLYAIPSRQGRTADAQLVQQLQHMYELEQEDARSVERVQRQLEQQGILASERPSAPSRGRRRASASALPAMNPPGRPAQRPRGWLRPLATVAAVLLVTVLVGGLAVGLILVRQGRGSVPGHATATVPSGPTATTGPSGPTPTSTPVPPPPAVYGLAKGAVVALNLSDGRGRWQYAFTPEGSKFPSLLETDDTLYLQTGTPGTLIALNKNDGTARWHQEGVYSLQAVNGLAVISLLPSQAATFVAFEASSGRQLWTFTAPQGGAAGQMLATDTLVYVQSLDKVISNDGNLHYFLYALDRSTGKPRWTYQSQYSFGIETVAGNTAYLIESKAPPLALRAIDGNTGKERWHVDSTDATQFYAPVVVDGVVYVPRVGYIQSGGGPGVLLALRESDGTELWHSVPSQGGVAYSGASVGQSAVYLTDQVFVYAFNKADGGLLWQVKAGGRMYSPPRPLVLGSLVYVQWQDTSQNNFLEFGLSALDGSTGKEVWRVTQPPSPTAQQGPSSASGDVKVLAGVILVYAPSGDLVALNAQTGQQLWQSSALNQTSS